MVDTKKLESIISQISGVTAVRIVPDGDNLREIHVIADSAKNPKQVVRDVETAILASTGLRIDRKIISVAQMAGEVHARPEYVISSLTTEDLGKNLRVAVSVEHGEDRYEGSAEGAKTSIQRLKTAAAAVISAFDELTESIYSVDDVRIITLAGKEFLVCHITKLDGGKERSLIGSAELEKDPLLAAANAALEVLVRFQ
ncbi:MAG TPA: hypothetical protein PLP64_05200 [Pseudothermotoga sp.]|nr:hypothetical protein [Pseudothermotoga sp.]HOK83605.1 hypothetical protein [Pseudothermotoga sp.]HPP69244.1 hypothetical protein [Pseudothermotoga sp.]